MTIQTIFLPCPTDIGSRFPTTSVDINAVNSPNNEDYLVNCFPQKFGDSVSCRVRSPINQNYWVSGGGGQTSLSDYDVTSGTLHGFFTDQETIWRNIDTTVYKNGTSVTSITSNSSNYSYFATVDTGTVYTLFYDQADLWTITGTTGTKVTDANFTALTGLVDGVVTLDGYTFVMDSNGTIYNSNVDDPTTWTTSTDFINAEIDSDAGVRLAKHLNYVVAFGERTTEFFYDAGNTTGSPLTRISSAVLRIGCTSPRSVVSIGNKLFWIGQEDGGLPSIYMLDGLTPTKISSTVIDLQLLRKPNLVETWPAFPAKIDGDYFYIVNNLSNSVTLGYNLTSNTWVYFAQSDDGTVLYSSWASTFDYGGLAGIEGSILGHTTHGRVYRFEAPKQLAARDFRKTDTDTYGTSAIINWKGQRLGNHSKKFIHKIRIITDGLNIYYDFTDSIKLIVADEFGSAIFTETKALDSSTGGGDDLVFYKIGAFVSPKIKIVIENALNTGILGIEITGELGDTTPSNYTT